MRSKRLTFQLILSKLLLCATVAAPRMALAQGPTLGLASGSGAPGGNVALSLNFLANGTQPTGIQWTLSYSSADISSVTVAATSAAAGAGEILSCSSAAGHVTCLMINLSSNSVVVPNGAIAVATFHISPTTASTSSQILMTGLSASDGNGSSLPISGTGGQITISQPTPSASLSNLSCAPASVATPGTATCTVTLTAAAAANTTVALASNSAFAAVPPSVVVPSGMSGISFTATASAVSANTSATLTASLNGNSRNFSLGLTASSVVQPGVSSVTCSPLSPVGGASVSCTVNLTSAAPSGGTLVTLSSNNSFAIPPNQVTIPAGLSSGAFTAGTSAVTAVQSSTISASSSGVTRSVVLTIQPASAAVLSNLTCTPGNIATPGTATCTVSLTAPAAANTTVALASNSASAAVPPSVVVPSGMSGISFTATASAVSANTSATLTASLNGNSRNFSLGLTASSVVQPGVSSVTCSPLSPVGGASVSCTVNLTSAAPSGGTLVTLSSNNSFAIPPNQVTIPAGLSSGAFTAGTSAVTAVQSSTITASSSGVTRSVVLTIQPPAAPGLSTLTCNPAVIGPGGTSSCTVTMTSSAPTGGTSIALSSSSSSVNVPNPVLIPSGVSSATFNVTAAAAAADVNAALTAALNGVTTSFQLTVTSQTLLVSVNCNPATVAPGGSSTCTVSLNKAAQGGIVEVLLSSSKPKVTVPGSVVIPAGNLSATFIAIAASDAANDSANLSATLGTTTVTTTLNIGRNPSAPTLVCNPSILQTPGTTTCTFTLSTAPQTNLLVSMSSTSASLTFPPSITIGAGTTSAMFTVTAAAVTASATVTLTAMGQGTSQTLTLNPPQNTNVSVTALSCGPQTLTGGGTSACNVTLSGAAPAGGARLLLSASSTQISLPPYVQVPEGSPNAEFAVSSALIDHDEKVTLTANLAGSSAQTQLSLAGLKLVSLACTPQSLRSGRPFTCQATLNSPQATGSVVLVLASSDPRVTVPASVAIQAGQAVFQANTTVVPLNQNVTVSASYHGVTVQATVTLTPAPPVLTAPGRLMVLPGKLLTFAVSATDPANLAVVLSASGLPAGAMFNPNGGTFNWVPPASQIGLYTVHFTATNIALVSTTQDVVIEVASDTPVIFSVANAASYVDDGGCSPGAVTTIVGSGFVKTGPKAAEISPIPLQINGVHVSVNGTNLPVFYAAENQINFQCPQLAPGDPVSLTIESETGTSPPHSSTMQFATPGIFTIDGSGKGQGAILIANSPNIAMPHTDGIPSAPAMPGEFVSIYATGLGAVSMELPTGSAAPLQTLDRVKAQVDVLVDGQNADVSFAGLAPGFTGLYQVNARIPVSASAGDAVPVQITVHLPDGSILKSNIVSIAIAAAVH